MKRVARDLAVVTLAGLGLGLIIEAGLLGLVLFTVSAAVLVAVGCYHLADRSARRQLAIDHAKDVAYQQGYEAGWDAFGRKFNADDVRWVS